MPPKQPKLVEQTSCERPSLSQGAYEALRAVAAAYLRRERADHTLQPTGLVHEAFLKVGGPGNWGSQTHFQAVAASAMRQILVDHARARRTRKRGGDRLHVTLSDRVATDPAAPFDMLALDDALCQLEALDARKSRVVELRFFGGMTCSEIGTTLGISPRTAEADWYFARAWLRDKLSEDCR